MEKPCLCFRLGDEWYLHDVSGIKEIIPYEEPSPVPGDSPENLGMLDVRGNVVNIMSGRSLLSLQSQHETPQSKVIVFKSRQGVVVDEVAEIVTVETEQVEQPPVGKQSRMIIGTINQDGKLFIMLDFNLRKAAPLSS